MGEFSLDGPAHDVAEPITREKIMALHDAILAAPEASGGAIVTFEPKLTHYYANKLYARQMDLPAGAVIVGKIHRTRHICVLLSGTVRLVDETGARTLTGPQVIVSQPGVKRAIWAVTDAAWINFHGTTATDLDDIEAELIAPSFEAMEG
jgi:hypothetical protein